MECAHDFEYNLQDSLVLGQEVPWQDHYIDLKRCYHEELRTITELMGDSWLTDLSTVAIPVNHFKSLTRYVRHRLPAESRLIHFLEHWGKVELRDLFTRFPYIAQATAQKVGKRLQPMRLEVDRLRVSRERFEPLAEVCIHLVNNLVDHGIEFPYERDEAGKPQEGELTLTIRLEAKFLSIVFSDDGRGIDIEAVAALGRSQGLLEADAHPGQILDLLFVDGFSTRGSVSETSGRGVGLSAVKEEVEHMGGRIRIESALGKGTSFMLLIPIGSSVPQTPKET